MELFALCKLAIMLTGMNFANGGSLPNEAETALPGTVDILHESPHAEIGVALHNPASDYLAPIAAEQTKVAPTRRHLSICKLNSECFNKTLVDCDFTGCQSETSLILRGKKLSGRLTTQLSENLPALSVL